MISVISFLASKKIEEDDKILRKIVDDMVSSNSSNKLDHIEYGTFEGHKDADFVITNPSFAIAGRAFVDRNQLYVLSALTKTPEESKNEFNHFAKTFKLNKDESSNLTPAVTEK
ncbi:MAG: hypothetical protein HWD61_02205 [Parachlamydiaceae bacterium]|nr:MAG: hypothetical protein HWD61_02205 [Parachlamydiaceae bacterium]